MTVSSTEPRTSRRGIAFLVVGLIVGIVGHVTVLPKLRDEGWIMELEDGAFPGSIVALAVAVGFAVSQSFTALPTTRRDTAVCSVGLAVFAVAAVWTSLYRINGGEHAPPEVWVGIVLFGVAGLIQVGCAIAGFARAKGATRPRS